MQALFFSFSLSKKNPDYRLLLVWLRESTGEVHKCSFDSISNPQERKHIVHLPPLWKFISFRPNYPRNFWPSVGDMDIFWNHTIFDVMHMSQLTLGWLWTNFWSSVDNQSSINWDVNQAHIQILIKSIDWDWTAHAYSTHGPKNILQDKECLGLESYNIWNVNLLRSEYTHSQ